MDLLSIFNNIQPKQWLTFVSIILNFVLVYSVLMVLFVNTMSLNVKILNIILPVFVKEFLEKRKSNQKVKSWFEEKNKNYICRKRKWIKTPLILNSNDKYYIPSRLSVFKFGEVEASGNCLLSLLRISTIRFLIDGDITVKTTFRSMGKIQNIQSITNPVKVKLYGEGTEQGIAETTFYGIKAGQEKMVVLRSIRKLNLKREPESSFTAPSLYPEREIILQTLFGEILKTPYHQAVGAYALAPTQNIRFLIYFPKNFMPSEIRIVQINSEREIIETGFRKEIDKKENICIVECSEFKHNVGIYAYWIWPKEKMVAPHFSLADIKNKTMINK